MGQEQGPGDLEPQGAEQELPGQEPREWEQVQQCRFLAPPQVHVKHQADEPRGQEKQQADKSEAQAKHQADEPREQAKQ